MSWPAAIKQAGVNKDLITCADILPTICQAAGIATPKNSVDLKSDGVSFSAATARRTRHAARIALHVVLTAADAEPDRQRIAFDQHYKLYRTGEFYDLAADPLEKQPLDVRKLIEAAAKAKSKLAATLDRYKEARPAALDDRVQEARARRRGGREAQDEQEGKSQSG